MNICEFETSLVYRVSSRIARAVTQRNPVSKKTKINVYDIIVSELAQQVKSLQLKHEDQ